MAETNLRDVLGLGHDYSNTPDTPIADYVLNPCLREAKSFDALFGFFSSESLIAISPGLETFFFHGGKIRLAICAFVKKEDVAAIQEAYEDKERFQASFSDAEKRLLKELRKAAEENPDSVSLLREMIAANRLEIIAVGPYMSSGLMHQKIGVFEDSHGNCVSFSGSSNLTGSAITSIKGVWNYEDLKVFRSWEVGEDKYCFSDRKKVQAAFSGEDQWLERRELSAIVRECIDSIPAVSLKRSSASVPSSGQSSSVKEDIGVGYLYDYQRSAVDRWFEMGCRGFFMMATGTGKTRTALAAVKEYWEKGRNAIVVVAVPLLALADQWEREIEHWLGVRPIMCNSKNPQWREEVQSALSGRRFRNKDARTVLLVTYHSKKKLEAQLRNYPSEKCLLLADEAHHIDPDWLEQAKFFGPCIGLSATPGTGMPGDELGPRIIRDFGGLAISLSLEEALEKGVLVPYDYYPLFCHPNDKEEEKFRHYTQLIAAALQSSDPKKKEDCSRLIRLRSQVVANCSDKISRLGEFIQSVAKEDLDHLLVYCGAGDIYGGNIAEEERFISFVHKKLKETLPWLIVSPFTSREDKVERTLILRGFQEGTINAITAIRCLDEGIDLPSIRAALILASGSTLREFIQRRGRILRLSKETGKDHASIYDVVCLPQGADCQALARYELRRFYEFARSARNWEMGLKDRLEHYLVHYGLGTIEEAFFGKEDDFVMEKIQMEGDEADA